MTASITEKAERLLLDGHVSIPVEVGEAVLVQGDHGQYLLVKEAGRWRCTCAARKKCSHILAVERVTG